ncbi:MAG: phosphotransferase, partial [Deltaproteobacteria bacterium]|nr:phosphotransferase [Deltaproteobacteria bacterium]MBW2536743.1 phosphotransferase [Deltaproteobacteria bacterium]
VQVAGDEDGGRRIELAATDEVSRGELWLAMERAAVEAPLPPPALTRSSGEGAIPARGQDTEAARLERLAFIRRQTGESLDSLEHTDLIAKRLTGNIENLVASVEIPVGLAGPLWFRGEHVRGAIYAPLATSEGTLVAAATRGARAVTRSGGVRTRVLAQRMMRVPLFVLSSLHGAILFADWVRDHFPDLREQTRRVSQHAELLAVEPTVLGRQVHVSFQYETGDAAGQNMTTSCTWHACQWLMRQVQHFDELVFDNFIIEGNMSGDKKVNFQSLLSGRGTRVIAGALLARDVVEQVLKVTPEQLVKTNFAAMTGGVSVGMVGYNVNVANIVAAVFAATGQDMASVHESSLGQLHVELGEDGLQVSMLMPSLIVGTVGGGTHLPRQQDLLRILGCGGSGKSARLAEIIAGFCLALDLSTLAAIAGGQFAHAHERLGRNRPVQWLRKEELDAGLFETGLRRSLDDDRLTVNEVVERSDVALGSSILTELTARKVNKLVGHFPYRLHTRSGSGAAQSVDVIVKVKPIDDEVILMTQNIASMCGRFLGESFGRHRGRTDFVRCDVRELAVYQQTDPRFVEHAPRVYGMLQDDSREVFLLVLELLEDVQLLDTADDVSRWQPEHIEAALEGIAQVHSIWYGREQELARKPWIGFVHGADSMAQMADLWNGLATHARQEFPEWIQRRDLAVVRELVRTVQDWWGELEGLPKTLIHNDFNPRNICFRSSAEGLRLCAYDWELATIGPPQRDLVELLAFVLPPTVDEATVDRYVEHHRRCLAEATGQPIGAESWRAGYGLCLRDYTINRLQLYLMAHTFRHYRFLERVVGTVRRLMEIETALV